MSTYLVRASVTAVAALAAALLCAAPQSAPALAATMRTPSAAAALTNCAPIYSVGHKSSAGTETWSYVGGDTRLYFYSGSVPRTSLCYENDSTIRVQKDTTLCLAPSGGHVQTVECVGGTNVQWGLYTTNSSNDHVFSLQNFGTSQCLYENTQEPAIMTSCSASFTDTFEWFYWPIAV